MSDKGYEQFAFDFTLPPNIPQEIPTAEIPKADTPKVETPIIENKINFAKVPNEEYTNFPRIGDIPTVKDIIRVIDKANYKADRHSFLSDVFECGAIAISNQFDKVHAEDREKRYLQIMNKYDKDMRFLIAEIFKMIFSLLSQQINPFVGFGDYLGDLYMQSETGNKHAGQFFTPYCVSKCCAEVTINEAIVNEHIENDKILTLNEPTCGAGGMILAAVDVLYNKYHFNYSRNLCVVCSDIDARCVHMSYLQLGLSGVPAVIYHQDALSLETWDRWETPAYIMNWLRFKDCFKSA